MSKVVTKLFREPSVAEKAVSELKAQGYGQDEIGVMVGELKADLASSWGIPEETIRYYEFSVSLGGTLVSVQTEEDRAAEARDILRSAATEAIGERALMWSNSPGFAAAGRMSATDPIDAPMSGDFRLY